MHVCRAGPFFFAACCPSIVGKRRWQSCCWPNDFGKSGAAAIATPPAMVAGNLNSVVRIFLGGSVATQIMDLSHINTLQSRQVDLQRVLPLSSSFPNCNRSPHQHQKTQRGSAYFQSLLKNGTPSPNPPEYKNQQYNDNHMSFARVIFNFIESGDG